MSKWNKNHGLIVPIDSLLKEKENTNRPAPLRSAGLVGRWGITSFTSIRNTSYEFESTSPKESDELSCSSNLASLSTQLPAAPKPKKFFKSRNNAPPATPDPHRTQLDGPLPYHQQIVQHQAAQLQARINQKAGGSPPYVAPAAGFYTQSSSKSPTKEEVVKEKKKPGRKKKVKQVEVAPATISEELPVDPEAPALPPASEEAVAEPAAPSSSKKEKKEKKEKKAKKVKKEPELPPELPKRNSSRIRNKVVNYNEDDDSFDSPIPFRNDTPPVGPSKLAVDPPAAAPEEEPVAEMPEPVVAPPPQVVPVPQISPGKVKEPKTVVPVPLSSPSVLEHPPIVLRISKGTSRLVSTDSEDVHSPPHGTTPNSGAAPGAAAAAAITPSSAHQSTTPPQQQSLPPPPSPPTREPLLVPPLIIKPPLASPEVVVEGPPRKDDLKIKISLGKSSLISNGGGTSGGKKRESKKELRHFKKRAIAREQKGVRASKRVRRGEEEEEQEAEAEDERLLEGVAEALRVDPIVIAAPPRPSFPLPGTDAYELYRTLASPSGGDDFDSQSSILGSASSNATPKHGGIAAAEDCRIIHSRGSSDCGSDLELSQNSQNSSTAAAPPSEINFESENTQELVPEEPEVVVAPPKEERVEVLKLSLKRATRTTRSSRMVGTVEIVSKPEPVPVPAPEVVSPAEPPVKKFGRATRQRNNNNNVVSAEEKLPEVVVEPVVEPVREPSSPPPVVQKSVTRQYNRRKKNVVPPDYQPEVVVASPNRKQQPEEPPPFTLSAESGPALASIQTTPEDLTIGARTAPEQLPVVAPPVQDENKPEPTEYKIKNKFKRSYFRAEELAKQREAAQSQVLVESAQNVAASIPSGATPAAALTVPQLSIPAAASSQETTASSDGAPGPVKLVISKKKGSIFKSRPLVGSAEAADKKRHVYKHKWDDDDREGKDKAAEQQKQEQEVDTFEGEPSGLSRVLRTASGAPAAAFDEDDDDDAFDLDAKLKCSRNAKPYYTVVRNVKKAHQIQEIGESQEMDDDVEYILSALQSDNPIATRCLSAMTLATKCMTPAFRMHVRAHGVVTRFFSALQDAHRDPALGLCTATIMFVLSQDTLNMDLDRDSLELMLNLLDTDHHRTDEPDPATHAQLAKNRLKVRELCEEIKSSGKAKHMDLDAISVGSLAMESLLSLTSKRAGDWFKDELRNLGGLEHLIKTVSDCCREISDYVLEWTDELLSKLRKIERCLRVLENVTLLNEQNQCYILDYAGGSLVATLAKLFKLVDGEVVLYPTNERTPKEERGAVLREVIPPILKIFISLTHPFNDAAYGASVIGSQPHVIETTLHLLLRVGDYVPQKFIFEMNILVLLFLINLSMYTQANRTRLMTARAPDDYGAPEDSPRTSGRDEMAVQALVEYFYRQDELARYAEKNTDAILDAKSKKNEDIEETVTKLLQKAGHHMEHTLMASYVCLLIGWLVIGSEENETTVRTYLREGNFVMMVSSLEKYYNFLNLTANSDALSLQHVRQTKNIIDNLKRLDAADRVPSSSSSHQPEASTSAVAAAQPAPAPHRYGSRSSTRAHY
uniref:Putative sister chromatid cohesion protein n=2 Tax=Culex tarsalis TaxID=7177 RepID=A0A1Q3F0X2_CULTA